MRKLFVLLFLLIMSCKTLPQLETPTETLRVSLHNLPPIMQPVVLHLYNTTERTVEQQNDEKAILSSLLTHAIKNNYTLHDLRLRLSYPTRFIIERRKENPASSVIPTTIHNLYYAWLLTPLNITPQESDDYIIYWELGEAFASSYNFEQAILFYNTSLETHHPQRALPFILCDFSRLYMRFGTHTQGFSLLQDENNSITKRIYELNELALEPTKSPCCYPFWAANSYRRGDFAQALHDLEHAEHFRCGRILPDEAVNDIMDWERKQLSQSRTAKI